MSTPTEIEKIVLIAVLRVLNLSQDDVASTIHVAKRTIVQTEEWIKKAPLEDLEAIFNDNAIKNTVGRELPPLEEVAPTVLVRAGQVTGDEILRHYREDYREEMVVPRKALTVEEIVIGEERKQAVLRHQDDLRNMASQWKSQIWIPSPWLWDVTDLNYVFYVDSKSHKTGYKLLEELESGEESNGHIKPFLESSNSVIWEVLEGGPIMLKTLVEDELLFGYLKSHTEKSSVWGLFTEWKEKGGTYIQLCSSLLAQIEREAKEKVGATSELSWWSIYHDAFCNEYTPLCCVKCGTRNSSVFTCPICRGKFPHEEEIELHIGNNHPRADPKAWPWPHCQICYSPLGLLRPLVKQYEFHAGKNPQSLRIDIEGGRNIEESVENERVNNYILGHAKLIDDYRGCDLVETILEAEKEVREVQVRLISEITSLSEQRVFHGKCSACPDH